MTNNVQYIFNLPIYVLFYIIPSYMFVVLCLQNFTSARLALMYSKRVKKYFYSNANGAVIVVFLCTFCSQNPLMNVCVIQALCSCIGILPLRDVN